MSLLQRLRQRLKRTRNAISDGLSGLFRGGRVMDQELFNELEKLLYTADLGTLAGELVAELSRSHRRGQVKGEQDVRRELRRLLLERLGDTPGEVSLAHQPTVILIVGVNGSGKTTTIAKLAHRFQNQGKRVLLAACDTFRAAAVEQLAIWAQRNGAEVVRGKGGEDPAAIAFDAVDAAVRNAIDVILIDTAGRLHTQKNLMQELSKIVRVVGKRLSGARPLQKKKRRPPGASCRSVTRITIHESRFTLLRGVQRQPRCLVRRRCTS